jgi:dTDP-4-dehydrorhamnose 3,5-epimerase-like enzyme
VHQIIEGVILIKPDVFLDGRGAFRRTFCAHELKLHGLDFSVCQGNISENSYPYTMRGFHYQKNPSCEAKIITPVNGAIYNVLIDLRKTSKTFLKSIAFNSKSKTLKFSIILSFSNRSFSSALLVLWTDSFSSFFNCFAIHFSNVPILTLLPDLPES